MNNVLPGPKWRTCLAYLDGNVVFSSPFHEYLKRLQVILQALRAADPTLKPKKCHLCFEEIQFLGHVISYAANRHDPNKVVAVAQFPTPSHEKALRRFLGFCAYYQRFIPDFALIASPSTRLTREDVAFVLGGEQGAAFNDLRQRLHMTAVLAYFDEAAPTMLHADVRNVGLEGVLFQRQDDEE